MDVLDWIKPDMRSDGAQEQVGTRAQTRHADVLTLEIRDAADASACKQFETADVLTAHHRDRFASIDRDDEGRRVVRGEIDLPSSERESGRDPGIGRYISDVGKSFRALQFVGDILRRDANAVDFCQSEGGDFGRCLLSKLFSRTK